MGVVLAVIGVVLTTCVIMAVIASLPALIVMTAFNWIAPQFDSHVHLGFLQVWLALFALGVVGRVLFGRRSDG